MITSSAATNGAPKMKKTVATASSDTTRYNSACTALSLVIIRTVETIAIAAAT